VLVSFAAVHKVVVFLEPVDTSISQLGTRWVAMSVRTKDEEPPWSHGGNTICFDRLSGFSSEPASEGG
jgi:hypothetical protein